MFQKETKREGEKRLFARNFKATYAPPHTTTNHTLRNAKQRTTETKVNGKQRRLTHLSSSASLALKFDRNSNLLVLRSYEALGKTMIPSSSLSPHGIIGSVFEFVEK
ncbi:hypothetical protein F2Q69_00033093 [Brassica cretica]|uniref:Uncharacterized protein n=1 Tax=Brassica cretica TaxID=69181 RepID=A0A8S9SS01_BRACR|nr:hypothetical protein F2Q69_00033093 [Brassica cretica]